MFYINLIYFNNALSIINDSDVLLSSLSSSSLKCKMESELKFTLIIKSTGNLELLFDDIMREFANHHVSPLFHKYFHNNFTKNGKNICTKNVENLFNNLDIACVDRTDNPQAYDSLNSLYNIRNNIAHGETSIVETYDDIKRYVNDSLDYMRLVINKLDSVPV